MMKLLATFFFASFILFTSCESPNPKDDLIKSYNSLYQDVSNAEYDSIALAFDQRSLQYVELLNDSKNLEFEKAFAIGNEYNLLYFTVAYAAIMKKYVEENPNENSFLQYLIFKGISIFNVEEHYTPNVEKTSIHNGIYVAVIRDDYGTRKMSYLNFTKSELENYKYNLLYTIKLHEKLEKKRKQENWKAQFPEMTEEEFLEVIHSNYIEDPFNPKDFVFTKR